MDITKASFWSKQHRNDLFTDRQNTSYNLTSSPASPPRPIFNNLLALWCCLCNSLQTPRVNPSRVVWGPSHALCRGLVRGSTQQQAGRPPVFRACAVGTLNPPRGAGGETHCQANVIYKPNHTRNRLEGLVVFHFSCQQIYSWFFHKQNRSEWVNNKILCSLIYNYLYFQKEWIFFVHLQIRQLRL